jgi:hypothetical protein
MARKHGRGPRDMENLERKGSKFPGSRFGWNEQQLATIAEAQRGLPLSPN